MLFNSHEFILIFLPLSILLYYYINQRYGKYSNVFLFVISILFIVFQGVYHLIIVGISLLINYLFISKLKENKNQIVLFTGIIINILILAFYKYISLFGINTPFPIGISFYTFQIIIYLIEAYKGNLKNINVFNYILSIVFFPKFIQGPIPNEKELLVEFKNNEKFIDFDNLSKGIYLFAIGLSKKVLIADKFSIFVNYGYQNISTLNSFEALYTILAYTFQLYFDFSGYSDMAMGIGYMFNIKLPINFNSPYKSLNISDFWKRWHITLTRFLTKYIYIPLGGNKKGITRTFVNIIIVYLISGIWHGTGITFIIWGLLQAFASILYRIFKNTYDKFPKFIQWIINFSFINISWVFFRASSVSDAILLLKQVIVGGFNFTFNAELIEMLLQPTFISVLNRIFTFNIAITLCFVFALILVIFFKNSNEKVMLFKPTKINFIFIYIILVMSILSLSGISGFLYTNF